MSEPNEPGTGPAEVSVPAADVPWWSRRSSPNPWASPGSPVAATDPWATPSAATDPWATPAAGTDPSATQSAAADPWATPSAHPEPPASAFAGTPPPWPAVPTRPGGAAYGGPPLPPLYGGPVSYPQALPPPVFWPPYPQPMPPRPRRQRGPLGAKALVGLAAAVALLAGGLGGAAGFTLAARDTTGVLGTSRTSTAPAGSTARAPGSTAAVAARVLPSVVSLSVHGAEGDGTGSGFVYRDSGYLLTNNHVVRSAVKGGTITAHFDDGRTAEATIVGRDPSYDLAVVKIALTGLVELDLGSSADVAVGDPVIAIGSPLGLSGTVTTGIVSAVNRPVTAGDPSVTDETSYINAIQTDAAINPGNSGGPLLDGKGRVIGINSAIASLRGSSSGQPGSIGLGFAIPIDQARRTADQLISTGHATHPIIGVSLDPFFTGVGALVPRTPVGGSDPVVAGGPAESAGMQPGDLVTALDGKPVADSAELIVAIRARQPGDTVRLTVRRDGSTRSIDVVLGESTG